MAATTPAPLSPPKEVENDNQQLPISGSPPQASVPPQLSPMEDVDDHQQSPNSNSPYVSSPPQTALPEQPEKPVNSLKRPTPEEVEDHQEPPIPPSPPPDEELHDGQQPWAPPSPSVYAPPPSSLPPPTGPEHSSENLIPEHVSEPPQSPTEPEDQAANPNFSPNHESPLSKQQPSPSTPPTGSENPVESPNYRNYPNPGPDHESPAPSSRPPESSFQSPSATTLQENPSPKPHQSPQDPSPPPPPTAASPSSPQETLEPNSDQTQPPLGIPLLLRTNASSSPSKPQPSPWTHQETANLIQAYQEKWYSLKKGSLKAGQWEEVAITVAARCGYDEPTKSAKQCRHKIEKLRKRYRTEKAKPRSKATAWNFFRLMDNLEKGPLPISTSQPMALLEYPKSSNSNGKKRKNDDSDGEFHVNKKSTRSKSYNHHIANGGLTRNLQFPDGGSDRVMRGSRTPMINKHKGFDQEDDGEEEEEEEEDEDGYDEEEEDGVAAQLAAEIKGFAERFVKMENKKMEMIRDTERYRMEMEHKRMEMILESQQMLVETVNKAFAGSHKTQKLSAN